MRINVAFDAGGVTLRGWLYIPADGRGPFPTIIMAHGFSALKEMGLDDYAEAFANAGLAALVYDNRNIGTSDGEPRGEIDPVAQMRDYRHAITYAQSRSEVDVEHIGVWGTSYTGGLVLIAAALDKRVKCVVSQVPYISGHETLMQTMALENRREFYRMIEEDRRAVANGSASTTVAVCTDDSAKPFDTPSRMSHRYFAHFAKARRLDWPNLVTVRSLDLRLEYEAMPYVPRISPVPLLMIVATQDRITPTDIALRAFEAALPPKKLLLLPGDHYLTYVEYFAESSSAARGWFVEHLK